MTWLYSLVITGLLFSSDIEPAAGPAGLAAVEPPPTTSRQQDQTERFDQTYPITANGQVRLTNINGSVVIEAWDRNEVKVEAVKKANSAEALNDVEIKVDARPDRVSIEADHGSWKRGMDSGWDGHRKVEVHFRLWVPRTAALNSIESVNGSIQVSNFVNFTRVSAVNGAVMASNLRGNTNLSTVNGQVTADFDQLDAGSRITLSTVNGRVALTIPSDSNATIKADSLNGNISNDFGLPVRKGKYVGRDMYGRVGSGETQIKLDSVNGQLSVGRRNDGRPVNPATNLLQQKGSENDLGAHVSREDATRVRREVARAVGDSKRVTAAARAEIQKGIQEAEKELANLQPEIARVAVESVVEGLDAIASSAVLRPEQLRKLNEQKDLLEARLSDAMWRPGTPAMSQRANTFAVKGIPKVQIESKGCAVNVRGWDKSEVKYIVTEFDTRRSRPPVQVSENQSDAGITIKAVNSDVSRPRWPGEGTGRVRIDVYVPKRSDLKIISDSEIRLEGVSGSLEVNGTGESINVRDADGSLNIANTVGRVRVIGFRGDVDARTTEGDVYLEGEFKQLKGRAECGDFIVTLPRNAGAEIVANVDDLDVEGLEPSPTGKGSWRIGQGGAKYNFTFTDGRLKIRSAEAVRTY